MPKNSNQNGFTLIELSIVMVIVALLAGGILVGQDLVYAAKVRAEFSQMERIDTAVNTFKLKYNALPGDMNNAVAFGLGANSDGNGNKRIQGVYCESNCFPSANTFNFWSNTQTGDATKIPEWAMAQQHLYKAGLAEKVSEWADVAAFIQNRHGGTDLFVSKIPEGTGAKMNIVAIQQVFKPALIFGYELNNRIHGHYYRPGTSGKILGPSSQRVVTSYLQTPASAKQIDQKFDDSNPLSGRVLAAPLQGSGCNEDVLSSSCILGGIGDTSNTGRCLSASSQDYDVSYDTNTCALRIKASF